MIVVEFDAEMLVAKTFDIDVNGGEDQHEKHHEEKNHGGKESNKKYNMFGIRKQMGRMIQRLTCFCWYSWN